MPTDLKRVTNGLVQATKLNPALVSADALPRLLREACDALTTVHDDFLDSRSGLSRAIRIVKRFGNKAEAQEIVRDADAFAELFTRQEAVALLQAGLSLAATNEILTAAAHFRNELLKKDVTLVSLKFKLRELRDRICEVSKAHTVKRDRALEFLDRTVKVTGGTIVVLVNAGHDLAFFGGLLPVAQTISGAVGLKLIEKGVTG